jgi:hypothetical protein
MTIDEIAQGIVGWLTQQPGVEQAEMVPDWVAQSIDAPPGWDIGKAWIGAIVDGVGVSISVEVTQ